MIEIRLIFNPSYVCHNMNIFWPAAFLQFPQHCRKEFSERLNENTAKPWKPSIIDESKCFVQIQEIEYFECSWCQNINPLMNKSILFLQLLVDHMLTELYLQNWVAGLVVLHSFLSKGLTWYVHLKVLARCVNNIFCLHKK